MPDRGAFTITYHGDHDGDALAGIAVNGLDGWYVTVNGEREGYAYVPTDGDGSFCLMDDNNNIIMAIPYADVRTIHIH